MSTKKKNTESRHGVRADGKTATSISISEDLLNRARNAAKEDGRPFSNWLEKLLEALKAAGKLNGLLF